MLSRVAESIYWMSRYIERAENVARFINVNLNLILDLPGTADQQWEPLVITTGDHEAFKAQYTAATKENVIQFLTFDRENPNSILSCLTHARENARAVRQAISAEMWEHINKFYLLVREVGELKNGPSDPHEFYERVRHEGQSFIGITSSTMTQGEAWHFYRLGGAIERADKTSRILDVKYYYILPSVSDVGTPLDGFHWTALLRSASAFEMYRQRHGQMVPEKVVEFLMLDRHFPRAVLFCLTIANDSLHAISGTPTGSFNNAAEQLLGSLRADLAYARAGQIISRGLHEFIDRFQTQLNDVGNAVREAFFSMRPLQEQFLPSYSEQGQ